MNKTVTVILLVVGIILFAYGIYTLIAPETLFKLGDLSVETQDNTNSYITIALGLVSVALGYFGGKKAK